MPHTGSYWFSRGGFFEVVRIVGVRHDGAVITHKVNSIWGGRLDGWGIRFSCFTHSRFEERYQATPAIDLQWVGPGSVWFPRHDARAIVTVEESNECIVHYRAIDANEYVRQSMAYDEFTSAYIRVWDEDVPGLLPATPFVVVGPGIRMVFASRWEAQACAFDVCTLKGLPEHAVRIDYYNEPRKDLGLENPNPVEREEPSVEPRDTVWDLLSDDDEP